MNPSFEAPTSEMAAFASMLADMQRRIQVLEVASGQGRKGYGFSVYRSTNDTAIAAGAAGYITFDSILDSAGGWLGSTVNASTFTVPSGGAGRYLGHGGVFWTTSLAPVQVSIEVNGTLAGVSTDAAIAAEDRHYCTGVFKLVAGDTVRLRVNNQSASALTPAAAGGSQNSGLLPLLRLWKISQ